jgi:predicted house-cleaning noncanonical NTP pyrophosphatase (MazG superfamily)
MQYSHTDTNFNFENEYPKLVRDRIPEVIKAERNIDTQTEVLTDDEAYLRALLKKLVEESQELAHSATDANLQEELADVFEVIYAILSLKNWTVEDIVKIQKEKREQRGGFEKRLLMLKKP